VSRRHLVKVIAAHPAPRNSLAHRRPLRRYQRCQRLPDDEDVGGRITDFPGAHGTKPGHQRHRRSFERTQPLTRTNGKPQPTTTNFTGHAVNFGNGSAPPNEPGQTLQPKFERYCRPYGSGGHGCDARAGDLEALAIGEAGDAHGSRCAAERPRSGRRAVSEGGCRLGTQGTAPLACADDLVVSGYAHLHPHSRRDRLAGHQGLAIKVIVELTGDVSRWRVERAFRKSLYGHKRDARNRRGRDGG
jgi:hypothetical protein